jgi:membrane protein
MIGPGSVGQTRHGTMRTRHHDAAYDWEMSTTRISYFRPPTSWWAVLKTTAAEFLDDNCLGLAAQLAFYGLLALFPALLFLVALLGYLPVEGIMANLVAALSQVAPGELVALIRAQIDEIVSGDHAGLLTAGILGALWSSSAGMVAIIDALNHAYDVGEWSR